MPPISRTMLKSKIHRATITDANLHYVGSVTVDKDLLDAADILPHELDHIVDINNGARFETYAIEGPRGSGVVCLNGAAARLVQPDDLVIIISYAEYAQEDLADHEPIVVHVDQDNRQINDIVSTPEAVPASWQEG